MLILNVPSSNGNFHQMCSSCSFYVTVFTFPPSIRLKSVAKNRMKVSNNSKIFLVCGVRLHIGVRACTPDNEFFASYKIANKFGYFLTRFIVSEPSSVDKQNRSKNECMC